MKLACVLLAWAPIPAFAQVQVESQPLGQSRHGRPLEVFTVWAPGDREPQDRPALLVVAGVEPHHAVGIDVAQALASRDWTDAAQTLQNTTLYIIPCLNPDGRDWITGRNTPAVELGRTNAPFDADRDGRLAEDPPEDLNGDGVISMMRVFNPPQRYGLPKDLVAESDDPRLSRPAKPEDAETGSFSILTEGIDNDGDGSFNEDGPGGPGSGIDLNLNFPTHFPEFREAAGPIPLSEPESRALVEWMFQHPRITGVLVLGPGDNLLNKPPTGRYDETGRIPLGLEKPDEPYHQHIADKYKSLVTLETAPTPNYEGSLLAWAYADFGAWAFQSAVWSRPTPPSADPQPEPRPAQPEPESDPAPPADERDRLIEQGVPEPIAVFLTATAEERQAIAAEFENMTQEERAQRMAQVRDLPPEIQARVMQAIQETAAGVPAAPAEPAAETRPAAPARPNDSDDGKWLTYSDQQRDGRGFIPWSEFDHPQLGRVEIGGFAPGFRINPDDQDNERRADQQAAFILELLNALPVIETSTPTVERLGQSLWRVSLDLCNPSYLPTSTAVGLKIGQPIAVHLAVEPQQVLAGRRVLTIDRLLGSGDCRTAEWLINADPGSQIDIEVRSARFGVSRRSVTLEGDLP